MDPAQVQNQKQQEANQKKIEEQRAASLDKILSTEAKERLGRIRLVKPQKARMVEDLLLQMAAQRNLGGPVEDAQLIELLNKVADKEVVEVTIKHRGKFDEGWDADDEGW
jgi:programmed cell death protein 5